MKGHRKYESDLEGRILTGNENERGDYLADEGGTGEWRPGGEKYMPLVKQARTLCVCVFDHCLIGLRSAPGRVNREGRNAFAPWSMSSICQGVCEGC